MKVTVEQGGGDELGEKVVAVDDCIAGLDRRDVQNPIELGQLLLCGENVQIVPLPQARVLVESQEFLGAHDAGHVKSGLAAIPANVAHGFRGKLAAIVHQKSDQDDAAPGKPGHFAGPRGLDDLHDLVFHGLAGIYQQIDAQGFAVELLFLAAQAEVARDGDGVRDVQLLGQ